MTFVDTGGWFSTVVPGDIHHASANRWLSTSTKLLITTDYVVDEMLTLLKARGQGHRAILWGERIFAGDLASIHHVTPDEVFAAWQVFRSHRDKGWSFTDCTSKVVMDRLGITSALAFDHHFRQFGNITVVP